MIRRYLYIYVFILAWAASPAHAQQRHADGIDNVLEHVPMVAVLALKVGGVHSQHDWTQLLLTAGASYLVTAGITQGLKWTIDEWRPDNSDRRSFPSGHTAFAFSGATVLHHEYGQLSPWVSVAGYGVATFVAVDRVTKDRHHWYDVAAGAAIGLAATEGCYWLGRCVFRKKEVAMTFTGQTFDVVVTL